MFGRVTDTEGKAIPYLSVYVKNTTVGTTTDADGYYFFKKLPSGNLVLTVEGLGYKPKEKTVKITYEDNCQTAEPRTVSIGLKLGNIL